MAAAAPGLQAVRALLLALLFEWGVALHCLYSIQERETTDAGRAAHRTVLLRKMARQVGKDYVLFPALSRRRWWRTLGANVVANGLRNVWAYIVIVCGHFADGAEKFDPSVLEGETKPEWYLRQMLGTANFRAGTVMAFMSGNLCYQIEHHIFPDLPSNRYPEIAERVRALCVATTCRTRRVRCIASSCSPCAQFASWRCRTGFSPPPPTTRQRPRPSAGSGMPRNDRTSRVVADEHGETRISDSDPSPQ